MEYFVFCSYVQKKPVIDKLTLNKSVHIYKKHRVQYEARTHYRTIIVSQ